MYLDWMKKFILKGLYDLFLKLEAMVMASSCTLLLLFLSLPAFGA